MNVGAPRLSYAPVTLPARAQDARASSPAATAEKSPTPAIGVAPAGPPLTLTIELDQASARFVQTLSSDDRVVRRYPDETQLAFSRGVCAYEQARRRA